jgi:hypothetical protein
MFLIVSKGTQAAYMSLDLQQYQGVQPFQKVYFKNKLIYDRLNFDMMCLKWNYVAQVHVLCLKRPSLDLLGA